MQNVFGVVAAGVALVAIIAIVLGLPTMLLWNWIAPSLTVEPFFAEIGFWKAVGLNFLAGILFKSSGSSS